MLEDGEWEDEEEAEDANIEFLIKMLKELDINSRQQEEKSSKRKTALENKRTKKLSKLQLVAETNPTALQETRAALRSEHEGQKFEVEKRIMSTY